MGWIQIKYFSNKSHEFDIFLINTLNNIIQFKFIEPTKALIKQQML